MRKRSKDVGKVVCAHRVESLTVLLHRYKNTKTIYSLFKDHTCILRVYDTAHTPPHASIICIHSSVSVAADGKTPNVPINAIAAH